MELADNEVRDVLTQSVATLDTLAKFNNTAGGNPMQHAAALNAVDGLLDACMSNLKGMCKDGVLCEGCFLSKMVMPTVSLELKAVARSGLCVQT
jgi:hypothetical protein